MKKISLQNPVHNWEKVNLVTVMKGGAHDVLKCSRCGIQGKRVGLSKDLFVPNNTPEDKIRYCIGPKEDIWVGKLIKVLYCEANNPAFKNCTPGSIHKIITPPGSYLNNDGGIWVMGEGEPVKLLFREYVIIKWKRRQSK